MEKIVKPFRLVLLFIAVSAIVVIYAAAIYELQIVRGDEYCEQSENSIVKTTALTAARGNILDRYGRLLVSNKVSHNITINRSQLLNSGDPNGQLMTLISEAEKNGVAYSDTLPVTSPPFEYTEMSSSQRSRLDGYLEYFGLDEDISASDLMIFLKNHYGMDYTTNLADMRKIAGIRYELELRVIMNIPDYVFAEDVDIDIISAVLEQGLAGVQVSDSYVRQYHTQYAAHLLGYTGKMDAKQYEVYKELGYSMDAVVGQSGAEEAFEEYLHGTDGYITTKTDASGTVTGVINSVEAVAGENVYLTIDLDMQAVAERSLEKVVDEINAARDEGEQLADGAAAVVVDVKTGEALACASYPSYDISTFRQNYAELEEDPLNPMLNRATQGLYSPGSTFKMVTAFTGLRTGTISRYTTIEDRGKYTKYDTYQPTCWIYPSSHGQVDVVTALENSCNYFFYWLGDIMKNQDIADTARSFGLGEKTGIEIGEYTGTVASAEYKEENMKEQWYPADSLQAAIGQSYNMFTPVQIANYVATIANGGTRYELHLLKSVKNYNYTENVYDQEPVVANRIDDENGYISILQQGMRAVAKTGTASSVFGNYPYSIAAKTGTVQLGKESTNNAVFVCYAPYDDPQIAIAVVVEKGGSGSDIMGVAEDILDYYFSSEKESGGLTWENTLIK